MNKIQAQELKVGDRVTDRRRRTWRVERLYMALNDTWWVDIKQFKDKKSFKITEFAFLDGFEVRR